MIHSQPRSENIKWKVLEAENSLISTHVLLGNLISFCTTHHYPLWTQTICLSGISGLCSPPISHSVLSQDWIFKRLIFEIIITSFSLPFPPSKPSHIPLLSNPWPLFSLIVIVCICACQMLSLAYIMPDNKHSS